jgi:hypothetical protein
MWFRRPAADDAPAEATLSIDRWERLLDALAAVNFWALDPADEVEGLDAAE